MKKSYSINNDKEEPKLIDSYDSDESYTEFNNIDNSNIPSSVNTQFKNINDHDLSLTKDFLVDNITNLHEYDIDGYYPIHRAIQQYKLYEVEAILERDPDCFKHITKITKYAYDRRTTVELAIISRCNPKIIKLLLKHLKCSSEELLYHQCKDGTILHLSILYGQRNLTKKIINDYPALISQRRLSDGAYPIHLACKSDVNIVSMIVNINSDQLNHVDSNGSSCDHYAAMSGKVLCLSTLLELREIHNIQNSNNNITVNNMNYTVLYTASYCGHFDMVNYIITSGKFPDLQRVATSFKSLPIHIAGDMKHYHIIQLLIKADRTIVNEKRVSTLNNVLPLNMTFNTVNIIPSIELIKFLIEDNSTALTDVRSRESPINKLIRLSGDSITIKQESISNCISNVGLVNKYGKPKAVVKIVTVDIYDVKYYNSTKKPLKLLWELLSIDPSCNQKLFQAINRYFLILNEISKKVNNDAFLNILSYL